MKLQHDLHTQLAFEKGRYKELADKVREYIYVQNEWKISKRSDLFYKKCNLEREIKILINPNVASQSVIEWMGK